jgi:hypothetical protein
MILKKYIHLQSVCELVVLFCSCSNKQRRLAPSIGHAVRARSRRREGAVGVRLPGRSAIVLADVLVLDLGACREVHSDCNQRE